MQGRASSRTGLGTTALVYCKTQAACQLSLSYLFSLSLSCFSKLSWSHLNPLPILNCSHPLAFFPPPLLSPLCLSLSNSLTHLLTLTALVSGGCLRVKMPSCSPDCCLYQAVEVRLTVTTFSKKTLADASLKHFTFSDAKHLCA